MESVEEMGEVEGQQEWEDVVLRRWALNRATENGAQFAREVGVGQASVSRFRSADGVRMSRSLQRAVEAYWQTKGIDVDAAEAELLEGTGEATVARGYGTPLLLSVRVETRLPLTQMVISRKALMMASMGLVTKARFRRGRVVHRGLDGRNGCGRNRGERNGRWCIGGGRGTRRTRDGHRPCESTIFPYRLRGRCSVAHGSRRLGCRGWDVGARCV